MRAKVTDKGLLIPREKIVERLGTLEEVEILEEPGRLLIVAGKEDPILSLGEDPVDDPETTDASVNHDRYLYG